MTSDDSDQLLRDGNQFLALGQLDAAELCFLRLLSVQHDHVAAQANLGWIRERQGALAEAEQHYRAALALRPDHVQLQLNLCVLLLKTRRLMEGEQLARQLVAIAPDSVAAWSQLGVLLACLERDDEAEQCYRHALALAQDAESAESPEQARVRFNFSYVLMRQGRWAEGWPLLESRWQFDQLPQWFDCPRWQGEPLAGKSLAIGLEAGQGDMIHFCRYAALAKAEGAARIGVVCHPSLKTLFASMDGIDVAYAYDDAVPREGWDYWTLPMAMPRWFATAPASIPAPVPYVHADPALCAHWRAILPQTGLRVGLVWQGNPAHENDTDRSLGAFNELAPLWAAGLAADPMQRAAIQFVSLQKDADQAHAASTALDMPLLNLGPQLHDFADTAAVIANLDLVISIDSAVAHLAGAMGKPCWLLLPDYRCDWRWLTERDDTPWYPNTRLFRQSRQGGWPEVIATVAAELAAWRAAHS